MPPLAASVLSGIFSQGSIARTIPRNEDALKPVLAKVSEMPDMPHEARASHLKIVADAASWALATLLLSHVDRARAGVYGMAADRNALRVVGGYAYGMLNVDSPSEEQFQDTEVQIVSVVAEILAVAFALAFPKSEREPKSPVER